MHAPAGAVVYQCTSPAGEVLFTDSACPSGYSTELAVPEPPPAPPMPAAAARSEDKPASGSEPSRQALDAEVERLKTELENVRLRTELEQERQRAIDSKLDALLDAPPVYGAITPLWAAPICKNGFNCGRRFHREGRRSCRARVPRAASPAAHPALSVRRGTIRPAGGGGDRWQARLIGRPHRC